MQKELIVVCPLQVGAALSGSGSARYCWELLSACGLWQFTHSIFAPLTLDASCCTSWRSLKLVTLFSPQASVDQLMGLENWAAMSVEASPALVWHSKQSPSSASTLVVALAAVVKSPEPLRSPCFWDPWPEPWQLKQVGPLAPL